MILVDSGAIYALVDKNDKNHQHAKNYYQTVVGIEILAISIPVLTEIYLLLDARLGIHYANIFWHSVTEGVFDILELNKTDIKKALEIEKKYARAGFGFVDATCFALCEKHKLSRIFTYDRKHFSIYKPTFAKSLELMPPS